MSEFDTPQPSEAERLIADPDILGRLKGVFAELDNLYSGIQEHTEYVAKNVDVPSITPSGLYIEAMEVATPVDRPSSSADLNDPEWNAAVSKYHQTKEFMIFSFNLADLADPDFTLRPLDLSDAVIHTFRGSGIEISTKDGTEIHLPQMTTGFDGQRIDGIKYNREKTEPFKDFRTRCGVSLSN